MNQPEMPTAVPAEISPDPLAPLFFPRAVAIVGASAVPGKRGYKAVQGLIEAGYRGAIHPIHPREEMILGRRCYRSVSEIPGEVDLAMICTPAATVPGLVAECGRKGIKGVVVVAGGFRESGPEGERLEEALLEAAQRHGVRVIGPNTSGMFNLTIGLDLLGLRGIRPGQVAFISQSGNMLLSLVLEAQYHGELGFSIYVGPGNQTDLGFNDYLRFLGSEPHTGVVTMYVEGFRSGQRFLDIARGVSRHKPVVVYKSGATEAGKVAARSHTGALAGSYAMTVDLLRQAGVCLVQQSDEILPVAEGLAAWNAAPGARVAVLSDGGGQATIAVDRLVEAGLSLAALQEGTLRRLAAILPPQASLRNPIDVAGASDDNPSILAECLAILAQDDNVDALLLVGMFGGYAFRFGEQLMGNEMRCAETLAEWRLKRQGKPLVVHSLYAPIKPPAVRRLREAGVPVYTSIEHSVRVLQALAERGQYLRRCVAPPARAVYPLPEVREIFLRAVQEGRNPYEHEARAALAAHGIAVDETLLMRSPEDVDAVLARFGDRPLALKIVSRDILHKSEAGGVRLDVRGREALLEAYEGMLASCRAHAPKADLYGVLVTPMAARGVEVIIGMVRDPVFGPVLMFGLGGIFVEVLNDVAFRAVPLTRDEAESMLRQLRGHKLLHGVRGLPRVDEARLVDLLLQVADFVRAYPEISELDLNPVIVHERDYTIADARFLLNPNMLPLEGEEGG
ncbi:acetate--CoA ligase family protein [Tepidiphilus sp. HLB4]